MEWSGPKTGSHGRKALGSVLMGSSLITMINFVKPHSSASSFILSMNCA